MSTIPPEENALVVQNTELEPADQSDERSSWQKFVDALRTSVGLKPVYLAERWTTAKIRNVEVDADAKLLAARSQYELAAAQARKMELEAEGKYEKDKAIADLLRGKQSADASLELVQKLLEAESRTPHECAEELESVIRSVQMLGGSVEIDTGQEPSDDVGED